MTKKWTPERDAMLRDLWPKNSASAIAQKLGGFEHCQDGGRNAVIGRAHRLDLAPKERPPQRTRQSRKTTVRASRFVLKVERPLKSEVHASPLDDADIARRIAREGKL